MFFQVSTLFSNIFEPHIQNLETFFAILVYFDFGYVCPPTPGVDPRGWPQVPPGHAAPPEELARAQRAHRGICPYIHFKLPWYTGLEFDQFFN